MARQLESLAIARCFSGGVWDHVVMRGVINESTDTNLKDTFDYVTVPADAVDGATTCDALKTIWTTKAQAAGKLP
jgi:hypothetical protein